MFKKEGGEKKKCEERGPDAHFWYSSRCAEGAPHHQPPQVTDAQQPKGVESSPLPLQVVISSQILQWHAALKS